jgi:hypothetical protein
VTSGRSERVAEITVRKRSLTRATYRAQRVGIAAELAVLYPKMCSMLLLRVQLPDRPGSLGAVASALGSVGADIHAVEIIDRGPDYAIDDFMLNLPQSVLPENLLNACALVEGVKVLWVSHYHSDWGVESDIATLNRMASDPGRAGQILTEESPIVFHSTWAVLVDVTAGSVLSSSSMAPEIDGADLAVFGTMDSTYATELAAGWQPGWGDTLIAVAALVGGRAIIIGRNGGPAYLPVELVRLQHLATLAGAR